MRHAWRSMPAVARQHAGGAAWPGGFVVQRLAAPGVPVSITGMEDPLFGPVVSFGVSGPATELLGDRSYRIPPMHRGDAAAMVREIRAAPLLFGYRGSDPVAVDAVEDLLLRVARLKNDLPHVRSLDLNLVLAGPDGATVLNAVGRVEPAADARSDWFVRRLSSQADTLPG
jgi:acyl-CoA synthetase (NDP forming)